MADALKKERMAESDLIALMAEYKQFGSISIRNQLVVHYSYIAKTVASQMRGIFTNFAQQEDIVNQGILTLIDCVERFDPGKGIRFDSYAFMRIRGAVIDFVRKQDWLPRRVRLAAKNMAMVHDQLCNELMREPTQKEIAERMNISTETLAQYTSEISKSVMFSFEELLQNTSQMGDALENSLGGAPGPETNIYREELRETLKKAIDSLSERERLVVTLYYYEHLKLSDIAAVMKVTEQRISQINSRAIAKLREPMEKYMKG